MRNRLLALAAVALVIGGCASAPNRCPVVGERASLAGTWDGQFTSIETGRNGTIHFELEAGQDSAYGDVLLIPQEWAQAGRLSGDQPTPPVRLPAVFRINFVQVSLNQVRGSLDRHIDPLCNCEVATLFEGKIYGDEIKGTYRTRYPSGGIISSGTWQVKRASAQLHARIDGGNTLS